MLKAEGRVLLLDVDGVLVTPPELWSQAMRRRYPGWRFDTALGLFFKWQYRACILGQLDLDDVLPRYLRLAGYVSGAAAFKQEIFELENHPNLPLLAAVRELRALGWPAFLATNQERWRVQYLLEDMRLGEVVDGEYSSASIGARKPDAAYFAEVTRRLGVAPGQIVFWDDAQVNVDAAAEAGWQAHLFADTAQFRALMQLPPAAQP